MDIKKARGIRKSSEIVTVAAAATPEALFTRTASGQNPRTVILRKIFIYNNTGGDETVDIGTGLAGAFANIIPTLTAVNGFDAQWTEELIPEVEVGADLTVQASALGVQVQVEVEEIG